MPDRVRAYFELLRFPAVFTAIADVMMGYLVTHGDLRPVPVFLLLVVTSSCLYLAGMVLNDVFDAEIDARERPERPIPSGRLSVASAGRVGWCLTGIGYAAAWGIFLAYDHFGPAAVAGALAIFIVAYDRAASKTVIGPFVMGLCRMLNIVLGMSTVEVSAGESAATAVTPAQLAIPIGMGIYITAVTWLAGSETTSPNVKSMIRYFLRGIIVIDSLVVLVYCGPAWAATVLALLVPMLLLERWASTT